MAGVRAAVSAAVRAGIRAVVRAGARAGANAAARAGARTSANDDEDGGTGGDGGWPALSLSSSVMMASITGSIRSWIAARTALLFIKIISFAVRTTY